MRQEKQARTPGKSKYSIKRLSGKMMYGPGCCGHLITHSQIEAAKRRAREEGRNNPVGFRRFYAYDDILPHLRDL